MQDRYVGDIGDFAKYSLLRQLAGTTDCQHIRVAVIWCLYPDEDHNGDGRHTSYLHSSEFQKLDAELFAILRQIVKSGRRSITAIVGADVLPAGTVFCD